MNNNNHDDDDDDDNEIGVLQEDNIVNINNNEDNDHSKNTTMMNNNSNNNHQYNLKLNSTESDGDSVSNTSHISNLDMTGNSEEEEEKQRLIERVLELQSTLEDLSRKVTGVKEENLKLKSENQILGNYIENLMQASNVFQSTWQQKQSIKKS